MGIIRRIWQEIKRGEDIDGYITIFAAFILVLLNILGIVPDSYLLPLILGILGLLAVSAVSIRWKNAELGSQLNSQTEITNKLITSFADIAMKLGTPADIIFEPIETAKGMFYLRLAESVRTASEDDEILVMAYYGPEGGVENPKETEKYKDARAIYSKELLNKASEPTITYRRVLCFNEGAVNGRVNSNSVKQWMIDHCKEILNLQRKKPGKISLKKAKVVFGSDVFVIRNKIAVVSLDIRDSETGLTHTDGTMIFHNPPDEKVIQHFYDFIMIADQESVAVKNVPE